MIRYKDLHMPQPCHKIHYDSLPYDPEKRPCHVCEKPVYDFRDKDEVFLNKIWKQHQGNFCGAFRYDQFTETVPNKINILSLQYFRNLTAGLILSLYALATKAQENTVNAKTITELSPADSARNSIDTTFMVMTKNCITCDDEVRIDVSINNVYYNSYRVNDSTIISLPATIKPTDTISIEARDEWNNGWTKSIDKVKKVEFQFGDKRYVELTGKSYKVLRFSYKRDYVGCPANFW